MTDEDIDNAARAALAYFGDSIQPSELAALVLAILAKTAPDKAEATRFLGLCIEAIDDDDVELIHSKSH